MKRALMLAYGSTAYVMFLGTILYFIGFLGNLTPRSIDSPAESSLALSFVVDTALVALFALQHSVMARRGFKRWWTRFVPPALERSTYVLASTAALVLLMWQWRPLGGVIWQVDHVALRTILYSVFVFGWVLLFVGTFLIDHFDLFGLRQVWLALRDLPCAKLPFIEPWLYSRLRHPLCLGIIIALWATPTMTATHLGLAVGLTAYIFLGIRLEERDLSVEHPEYPDYQRRVPMLFPRLTGRKHKADLTPDVTGS